VKDKDLRYYLSFNYDIIIRKIDKYDDVFYEATTRELDPLTFYGVGDTPEAAIESLEEVKQELFPYYLENGIPIAEPEPAERSLPSGRFIVRIPPAIHKRLISLANRNKQSLNAFITSIFERYTTKEALEEIFEKKVALVLEKSHLKSQTNHVPSGKPVLQEKNHLTDQREWVESESSKVTDIRRYGSRSNRLEEVVDG